MVSPEVLLQAAGWSGVLFLSACVETPKLGVLEGPPEIIRCILVLQWPGAIQVVGKLLDGFSKALRDVLVK